MNPASQVAVQEAVPFATAALWVNWLVLLPFLAAAVVAAYSRMGVSRHWPSAPRDLAGAVALLSGLAAAILLLAVPSSAWPLTADYRWTENLFQFRLRLDRFGSVVLMLLSWQFAFMAFTGRTAGQAGAVEDVVRRQVRQAVAILAALGCCTGALLAADFICFLLFWQALAVPVTLLLVLQQPEGKESARPAIAYAAAHTLGSMAVLACFALAWTETGTTDPFAAGMSLLMREVAPLRAAAALLAVGFGCTIIASAALAVRPAFARVSPAVMTLSACLLMRYLHLLFWGYVLAPIGAALLWVSAAAACAVVGTALALNAGPRAAGLLVSAGGAYLLFAAGASASGSQAAGAAMGYVVGLGAGLPLLAVASGLVRTETGRTRRDAARAPAMTRAFGLVAVLAVAGAPGLPAFFGLVELVRALGGTQLAPLAVTLASAAGFLACGVLLVQRGRWLAASELGWSDRTLAAAMASAVLIGVLAYWWVPAVTKAAPHFIAVGSLR